MESPEKISTSVLANRLQLFERAGIAEHILSKSDKKIKLYFLTDRGIDLFPILHEMVYWSKRNLNREFHPFSIEWFKRHKTQSPEETITQNKNSYKIKREKLLKLK